MEILLLIYGITQNTRALWAKAEMLSVQVSGKYRYRNALTEKC
jgi:hypothetical protein